MAKLQVGPGFFANFDTTPLATASGDILVSNDHLIRIDAKDGLENFIGRFHYNDEGLPLGTIDKYLLVSAGDTIYAITHADIDVLELRETAASGNPEDFLKLIFRGDDDIAGANLDDTMAGYKGDDHLHGLKGDDTLSGLAGRDKIAGGAGNDVLLGGTGRDALYGGSGDDWLDGGPARNSLTGGGGHDTFVFVAPGKPDTIADFHSGDRIALGFAGLGPTGTLDPDAFHRGASAENRHQKILYDSHTGSLLYAKHGSATDHPVKFAEIGKGLDHLDAHDFFVL
jgi:Ca2+-binding RTX toxin-like protein